jgi:tetratricopeptide (TPR) repeat protein
MTRTFQSHPLPEALRDLLFDQASGVLTVQAPNFRADVMLDRGSVIYCRSDAPAQKLENLLVKWGFATAEQVPGLVQRAGANVKAGLVREGIFPTEAAFDDFMGQILRERVVELFAQPQAAFDFQPKDVSSLKQVSFPSSTPDVILEGCRRLASAAALLEPLRADDVALQLNDRPAVTLQSLHMAPAEGYVLSLVTGASVPAEILRVSPLGPEETLRLLYALLVLDLVRHPAFAGRRFTIQELAQLQESDRRRDAAEREIIDAEYRRVRALDLFQIVPNAGTLDPDSLRAAVRSYQEKWRTDRFSTRIARDLREQLTLIQGRAGELLLAAMDAGRKHKAEAEAAGAAPEGGGDDKFKRLEFMKSDAQAQADADQKMAQAYFSRACEAYRGKDYHSTVQFVREAIRRHETAEYQALLGDALSMNPHWGKKAEEAYMRAMQLDPYDPRLPLALGRIYARAGLKQRARDQFDKALTIQPDFEDAKLAMKELGK